MAVDWNALISNPGFPWALIAIVAILAGGIQGIAKMYFRHQERIAMIEQGVDLDQSDPQKRR
ncbi:MAG: hypothetical protein P8L85_19420 [Rubripirellula sp.]|nr:hypothetical protein [Rubripirellula sp.]